MVMASVLVIENEDSVRENILELLEAEGFEAIGAGNGAAGIRAAQQRQPGLILCDVLMPDQSGYEVLAAVRQHRAIAATPFVFLSAKVAQEDAQRAMTAGADYYLTKPFAIQELLRVIHSFLNLPQTG